MHACMLTLTLTLMLTGQAPHPVLSRAAGQVASDVHRQCCKRRAVLRCGRVQDRWLLLLLLLIAAAVDGLLICSSANSCCTIVECERGPSVARWAAAIVNTNVRGRQPLLVPLLLAVRCCMLAAATWRCVRGDGRQEGTVSATAHCTSHAYRRQACDVGSIGRGGSSKDRGAVTARPAIGLGSPVAAAKRTGPWCAPARSPAAATRQRGLGDLFLRLHGALCCV